MTEAHMVETVLLRPSAPAFSEDGAVAFGVRRMLSDPPRMLLGAHVEGADREPAWLSLGDTAEFGGTTWRFEDVRFTNPDSWIATVRSVPSGAPHFIPPPPVGDRVWNRVELRPHGRVDEAAIVALEQRLGLPDGLPPGYRQWLADNNGATPAEPVHIPGFRFRLSPARPLLGIDPDEPHRDLGLGPRRAPDGFTRDHVVIAVATGGLLAVRVRVPGLDEIVFLNELGATFGAPPLETVAPDIYAFCGYLQPAPAVAPAHLEAEPEPPEPRPGTDVVDLVGKVLARADRGRASMCAEFGVRFIAEVAAQARAHRVARHGRCADGLRYFIHGNGYDVFTESGVALTLQANGFAHVDRKATSGDGLVDLIDLYALRMFLEETTGTTFDLDALAAACGGHGLQPLDNVRYALPPVPGGVEEQQ